MVLNATSPVRSRHYRSRLSGSGSALKTSCHQPQSCQEQQSAEIYHHSGYRYRCQFYGDRCNRERFFRSRDADFPHPCGFNTFQCRRVSTIRIFGRTAHRRGSPARFRRPPVWRGSGSPDDLFKMKCSVDVVCPSADRHRISCQRGFLSIRVRTVCLKGDSNRRLTGVNLRFSSSLYHTGTGQAEGYLTLLISQR